MREKEYEIMKDSYMFPPLDLLEKRPVRRLYSDSVIIVIRSLITMIFNGKGIRIEKMYPVVIGPSVYYFEIVLSEGIDIDIIRDCLADHGKLRIVSLVSDNRLIAIEVPRHDRQNLYLRDILETKSFERFKGRLPIALGMPTKDNKLLGLSLTCLQHLLISGGDRSGKSMLLHCIIISLLYSQTPKELKLVLVDTKNEEFGVYNKIEATYLYHDKCSDKGVITSDVQAVSTLYSLCEEMDRRLDILADQGLDEYNEMIRKWERTNKKAKCYLPYIVVVIDEFSELIKIYGKHFEIPLHHLAQMGHKVGIHLVISTWDTSESVVTRLVKSVFSTRISCKVSSAEDSRRILDISGAELLSGKGDMLYSSDGYISRVQGCFVNSRDIESVCDWIALCNKEETQCHIQESKSEDETSEDSTKRNCIDELMESEKNRMDLIKALKECLCMIESSSDSIDMRESSISKNDIRRKKSDSNQPEYPVAKRNVPLSVGMDTMAPHIGENESYEEDVDSDQYVHIVEKDSLFKRIWRMIAHKKNVDE